MTTDGEAEKVGESSHFTWRILAAISCGLLLSACFPPLGQVWILPFAIAGLLSLLDGLTVRQAAYLGFGFGLALFTISLRWLFDMFHAAAIPLCVIESLFPMTACALFVRLRERLPKIARWILFAVIWTATEYFRSELMIPAFGWMGLGYAVVNNPILATPATVIGSYGVSFLLVAFSGILYETLQLKSRARMLTGAATICTWLVLLSLPRAIPQPIRPMSLRLVQAGSEEDFDMFRMSRQPSSAPLDLIMWPEYSYDSDPRQTPKTLKELVQLPREERCFFLFGAKDQLDRRDAAAYRNTAFLLAPNGLEQGRHVKNHTVPFFQDGIAGTAAKAITTPLGRLGIGICFDMDYPDVSRRLVNDGAEVLLVPSDNPREWGALQHIQHRQLFQMRAIECGRWLATTDVAGSTYVVAPTGRIIRSVNTPEQTFLDVSVGRASDRTLFARGGWRFGQLCLCVLAILILLSIRSVPSRLSLTPNP